jgi:chromosome segregation ATPase
MTFMNEQLLYENQNLHDEIERLRAENEMLWEANNFNCKTMDELEKKLLSEQAENAELQAKVERLTTSLEASRVCHRTASEELHYANQLIAKLQARVEELEADAETHDAQLTKVARLRLDLESENIRLQARVDELESANAAAIDAFRNHGLICTAQFKELLAATEQER